MTNAVLAFVVSLSFLSLLAMADATAVDFADAKLSAGQPGLVARPEPGPALPASTSQISTSTDEIADELSQMDVVEAAEHVDKMAATMAAEVMAGMDYVKAAGIMEEGTANRAR